MCACENALFVDNDGRLAIALQAASYCSDSVIFALQGIYLRFECIFVQ